MSSYCKVENGCVVGLDMEKINQRQQEIDNLTKEIKRVNAILRNKPNPHEYRQNKKYLERLERKLRTYESNND